MAIDHIVAATDLSAPSLAAVERGFLLTKETGAKYTVVHALGLDALDQLQELLGVRASDVSKRITDDARDTLREALAESGKRHGVTPSIQLEERSALSAVPSFSERNHVDLVVLGARGSGIFQRVLIGSTASRLLHKCKCQVLVVKTPSNEDYRRLLVAVDFSPASLLALQAARAIAPNADIVLLHAFDVPFEGKLRLAGVDEDLIEHYRDEAHERAMQRLHELATSAGLTSTQYTAFASYGDATREIVSHQQQYHCDLIAVGKHGKNAAEEFFLGSVTKHVLSEADCDVLVVADKRPPQRTLVTP